MSEYLDYNSSTPVDERILDVMMECYKNHFGNANSRTHEFGAGARKIVEQAREQTAQLLDVNNDEIIFTSGATESDNIAILGLESYGKEMGKQHIITTAIEHKAVLEPCRVLEKKGFEVEYIKPNEKGKINVEEVLENVREDTLLVSIMHVNNETGVIQPVKDIGDILYKKGVLFHIDAAQSCGKLVDELKTIKYNMLSITAHKMYGPQGIGALIMRKKNNERLPVKSITFGGSQEDGIRPGTLPVALIAGMGKTCEIARREYKKNLKELEIIKKKIIAIFNQSGLEYKINGEPESSIPNTLNVSFLGQESESLMMQIKKYCSISNGSACTSKEYQYSYVLEAMGLPKERIEAAVRISWGTKHPDYGLIEKMTERIKVL